MEKYPAKKKVMLVISLLCNLGMLGFFKYFNFFIDNFNELADKCYWHCNINTLKILLPVGISFYTFQTLSYTIDIYRGKLQARKNFIDFALFVSFFPQLVAGPIERAVNLLPQMEEKRKFNYDFFASAFPLIIRGYLKKMVIADNVAIYADKVFMLNQPTFMLLAAGTLAFAFQIYTDFSAYTDIARGTSRLLGFELMENFKSPYLAISPSDFWRRWHISFSSWIRDYLYIPLGGSKNKTRFQFAAILVVSMGLSGLWHGASWNFVLWGIFHAIILFVYHQLGFAGKWKPATKLSAVVAWFIMISLTMVGWAIFRTPSVSWLFSALTNNIVIGLSGDSLVVSLVIIISVILYALPLLIMLMLDRLLHKQSVVHGVFYGLALALIIMLHNPQGQDFIYFQF
ncbi:MAG: MBOAT family protein [Phycisphaerae bacterium]|nr:MBOAT family protein [Phycisphaerae bacterium]